MRQPMIADFAQRWHEIEPLIDQLFEVAAPERVEWLRRHCADATLRVLITQALDNAPGNEALERGMAQWLPAILDEPPDALPIIAGYRMLRFVGAGGMASVFEAERALPGGPQTVALKLLRVDVHDADERRRFLREQRILARLQHPHIAQLLDAGFSPTGTPFLALEFVAGSDLITHCERNGLVARERLRLFIEVATAVEHAHRSLIVHRDLKPSNVLVGADGGVKLVDFGIAKLLGGEGEATRTEVRRLTRSYAAPEQFSGDIATTAIDVYALGILLAELLCGTPPRRREVAAAAKGPAFDDEILRRKLGIDLHAIVQAATRPDPQRRYASAAALRDDIERYLAGRPLQVRPDTLAYRTLSFAKRHVWAVSAGMLAALVLAGATAVGLHEAGLARRAAQRANAQALSAEAEARRADALKSFLEALFDSASHGTETNETAEELLAQGRQRADRDFVRQPALRIEILALIGDLERRSGHPERAQQPLEEAATLAGMQFGPTDRRTLHIEYLLAKEADQQGRFRVAARRLQQATDAFEAGPNHASAEEVQALAWLAGLDERIGESASAVALGDKALALARRVLPADSDALTEAVLNLGWIQLDAGHPGRATPLLREALARKRARLGERHAEVADTMAMLTSALTQRGGYAEGEQLMRAALAIDAAAYARPNAHMAWHLNDLAIVLALEGRLDEAGRFYAKSIAIDQAIAPTAGVNAAMSLGNLARIRFRQGAYAEAETDFRTAIERKQQLLGADYGDNGRSYDRATLAEILIARGAVEDAATIADGALAEARRQHRAAHPELAYALTVQAEVLHAGGANTDAAAIAGQAVAMYAALRDQDSEKAIRARLLLGEILQARGRDGQARAPLQSALTAAAATTPNNAALVAHAAADLARVDSTLGDAAAASLHRGTALASLSQIGPGPDAERDATVQLLKGLAAGAR